VQAEIDGRDCLPEGNRRLMDTQKLDLVVLAVDAQRATRCGRTVGTWRVRAN